MFHFNVNFLDIRVFSSNSQWPPKILTLLEHILEHFFSCHANHVESSPHSWSRSTTELFHCNFKTHQFAETFFHCLCLQKISNNCLGFVVFIWFYMFVSCYIDCKVGQPFCSHIFFINNFFYFLRITRIMMVLSHCPGGNDNGSYYYPSYLFLIFKWD